MDDSFTRTIAIVESDVVDADAATGAIGTPCALEDYVKVAPFVQTDLCVVPRGALVVVQLPDWPGLRRRIFLRLHGHTEHSFKFISSIVKCLSQNDDRRILFERT